MAEDKQYGSGSIVDIDRLTKLKAKVKAECLRRKYTGSVENYGSSTYDFSNNPTVGGVIKREYYDKNATPLNVINNNLVPKANITDTENVALNDKIDPRLFVFLGKNYYGLQDKTDIQVSRGIDEVQISSDSVEVLKQQLSAEDNTTIIDTTPI